MTTTATTVTTNEELAVCIREGNTELLPELWENTRRFIYQQAGRYYRRLSERCAAAGVTVEDLEQEGYFALVDAVAAYDGRYNLLTYLTYPLLNRYNALAGMRQRRNDPLNRNGTQSLDEPLTDELDFTLADTVPDPRDHYEDVEARIFRAELARDIDTALAAIPADKAEAVRVEYFQGLTIAEAAQAAGVYPETIRQRRQSGLRCLRRGKALQALMKYQTDIIDRHAYRGSLASFRHSRTSSTERTALMIAE